MTASITLDQFPSLLDFEKKKLKDLHEKIIELIQIEKRDSHEDKNLKEKNKKYQQELKKIYSKLTYWERSQVARHPNRPHMLCYIKALFTDFVELHGDRKFADDPSFVCGFATFNEQSIAVVGNQKDSQSPISRNFGMGNPEGYRKALRIFKLANKFNRPIITFIDTPGAYPGKEGEERGQGEAIACNLKEMFGLTVPIICIVTGEGGSGGALGIGVGDHIMMLEHSIYSVISPESFASIIWRDASRKEEAAEALKNDPKTALKYKLIDEVVSEPIGGAHRNLTKTTENLGKSIEKVLKKLTQTKTGVLVKNRREKFSTMGVWGV